MNLAELGHALSYVPLAIVIGAWLLLLGRRTVSTDRLADPAPLPGEIDEALSRDGQPWPGLAADMERIVIPAERADWQAWETEMKERQQ